MSQKKQTVRFLKEDAGQLATELFRQNIPKEYLVLINEKKITHYHSYGSLSPFFENLIKGKLMGTICVFCENAKAWLPPRTHCPDCWKQMEWVKINTAGAKVYTHSTTNYPGAGFKLSVPCPLISVDIPGVYTKFMSYLSKFGNGEPYIGMPIKPVFRKNNPTYTILDISWIPVD